MNRLLRNVAAVSSGSRSPLCPFVYYRYGVGRHHARASHDRRSRSCVSRPLSDLAVSCCACSPGRAPAVRKAADALPGGLCAHARRDLVAARHLLGARARRSPSTRRSSSCVQTHVAQLNGCTFCVDIGRAVAVYRRVTLEKVDTIDGVADASVLHAGRAGRARLRRGGDAHQAGRRRDLRRAAAALRRAGDRRDHVALRGRELLQPHQPAARDRVRRPLRDRRAPARGLSEPAEPDEARAAPARGQRGPDERVGGGISTASA